METIKEIQTEIIEEFEMFDDWMQKYEYLIDLGKELVPIEEQYKTEDNLIKGCQSRVWLHAQQQDGKINYTADSDAIMTKGIIAILIRVLSGQKAEEIVSADLSFIDTIGLKEQLSATRANGLVSMIKKIGLSLAAITLTLTLAAVAVGYYWYSNAAVFGASMTPAQQRSYITSSNFSETLFINQINTDMDQTFGLMAGALWDYVTAEGLAPEHNLEIVKADPSQLNNANNKTQLMWLGHSSFLLQSANQTLLFDPIFSDTAAPHPALV